MGGIINRAKRHLANVQGKRLRRKFVVFESDDWGSERMPSLEKMNSLISNGVDIYRNPFNYLDSLETGEDLSALFDTLQKFRDKKGNHPVITANSLTANPDFKKIKESDFLEYHFKDVVQSYSEKSACQDSIPIMKQGMESGLFHPQFHGREHLNVKQWLAALRSGHDDLIYAFDAGVFGIDLDSSFTRRTNFMAAFDSDSPEDLLGFEHIIQEGMELFKMMHGYTPKSFIAPNYIWHPHIERYLLDNGVEYLQGLPLQRVPVNGSMYRKVYHHQGERNKLKQRYFVRNCFFEPSTLPDFDWVEDCLERMKIIFYWGKPAIIGTHRINFIGSLNEQNRSTNLDQLSVLLKKMLELWPDLEFLTTDRLGELY